MPGNLFIIAAPSGAGKTSLVKALVESMDKIEVSVSTTTRPMRTGEEHGVHYEFVDQDTYDTRLAQGDFLEHAEVFGNRYGTSRQMVLPRLEAGIDIILEIDWQGARQVRETLPQAIGIFILPPSRSELENRLRSRGQDDEEVIMGRMQAARAEISHYAEFDYLVVNDRFDEALNELRTITTAHRLRQQAQGEKHADLLQELLAESVCRS